MRPSPFRLWRFRRWLALASVLAALLVVGAGAARAVTYANTVTTFSWIDSSSHTKVGYGTAPYKFNGTLSGGTTCGTAPPTLDDVISDLIPIGFTFMYGGVNFTQVRIMSNGRIQFGDDRTCGYGSPVTQLPYPNASLDYTMRIYGNDLDLTAKSEVPTYSTVCLNRTSCYVSYATLGTAPNRSFVVTWSNVPEWASGGSTSGNYNLQVILQENGEFIYQYGNNTPGPGNTTAQVGWQVNSASDYDVPAIGYPASNTAIKFYIPRPTAEYRMEQASWNGTAGEVIDSSGNGWPGVRVGSAQTTAGGKVCRGASIPLNTTTSVDGIDTGISIPTAVGGQGTITFWFKPNEWTGASAQSNQLFDATIAANQWFFLTKRRIDSSNVTLRFVVRDSTGTTRSVETGNLTSTTLDASGWVHVAVSWNFNALAAANSDRLRIYVNGALSATSAFTTAGTTSTNIGTLYVGDNRSANIEPNGTPRSANGVIDEFRIYNYEGGLALVQRDMNQTGVCLNHYAISNAGSGPACQLNNVTITAHDATHNPVVMPNNTTQIRLSTSTGLGDWSLVSGYGVLNNGTAGDGVATYLFDGEYQAVFALNHPIPGTVNINVTDGAITESASEDPNLVLSACVTKFNACHDFASTHCSAAAGRLYTRLAGVASAYDVVALDSSDNQATAFTGKAVVSLIARTTVGGVDAQNCFAPDYSQVLDNAVTSFSSGRLALAGISVPNAYREARIRTVCDSTNCPPSGMTWCTVDNFAIRPQAFAVTANLGGATLKAGQPFTMTAASGTTTYDGTPVAATTAMRDHNGAGIGTLTGSFAAASGGSATATFRYQDVGTISLLVDAVTDSVYTTVDQAAGDCVAASTSNTLASGKYGCTIGSAAAGPFGRFYPDHFTYTATLTPACGGFVYMDQPALGIGLALEARSANETVTQRYTAGYGWLGTFSITGDNGGTAVPVARLSPALPAFAWTNGAYAVSSATSAFTRGAAPDGPYQAFALKANILTEPDGVTISGAALSNTAAVRFGRLRLANVYGYKSPLAMPVEAQYWSGASWVKNADDSCTTLANGNLIVTPAGWTAAAPGVLAAGAGSILLTPTGTGTVSVCADLGTDHGVACSATSAALPWLQSKWPGGSNYDNDPAAQATYGIFSPEGRRGIYQRELY